jgi:hypothetical protein
MGSPGVVLCLPLVLYGKTLLFMDIWGFTLGEEFAGSEGVQKVSFKRCCHTVSCSKRKH